MAIEIKRNIEERKRLDELAEENGITKFVDYLPPEIILIEPPTPDKDCEEYALGTVGIRNYLPYLFQEIDKPQEGDIVLYKNPGEGIVHIGRYQKDGSVISKWNTDGPVLKHPLDLVPLSYGTTVIFQRIPESKLEMLRKPDAPFYIMDAMDNLI